jgi:hypothetical protein
MSKQTAVEWLIKELKDFGYYTYNLEKLCDQAKQMEETEYKERLVKEFNPRLFNKPSKELPTDEEIYEFAEKMLAVDYLSFTEGAKWMRDKIKGGHNE